MVEKEWGGSEYPTHEHNREASARDGQFVLILVVAVLTIVGVFMALDFPEQFRYIAALAVGAAGITSMYRLLQRRLPQKRS